MTRTSAALALAAALAPHAFAVAAGDVAGRYWPSWRGPTGNAVAPLADPPVTWGEGENVRWKVPIPGNGLSSPVVWDDRVFVLTAAPAGAAAQPAQRFLVMAVARDDGRILWQRTAVERVPHESHHGDSSWASASPVTDGEIVIAHFGSSGTFAYDLDGTPLWQVDLGDMTTRNGFGEGSSPTIAGDRVIVLWDHEGDSFLVALDKRTGAELWRAERPGEVTSWSTPLVVERPDGAQVIVPSTGRSRGYDLATGEEIWSVEGMTVNTIPSAVHRGDVVYLMSGFRGTMAQAIDLARARGPLEGTEAVVWEHTEHTPYVSSPLLYGDQLYFFKHLGNILTSLDAASGEVLYTEVRVEGLTNVWSSPVAAAGRIYVLDRNGDAVVLAHGPELRILATNRLEDRFDSTPALVDDEIYLRGRKSLYCISSAGRVEP